ncbi:threonine synthase [Portibacter marinus]|uniref:threonine synthase n=1 Tax=Portibacter marinus TaxID=2898660 RepID=UPI001F289251|nr:threonine synthase [Portibacter marinus]
MDLYSTNNESLKVDLKEAVLQSLPADNGLYLPSDIPSLSSSFLQNLQSYSFEELSYIVAKTLLKDSIPDDILKSIVRETVNFQAPIVPIHDNIYSLELFHGPTLAFKDFGARFMSRVMKYFKEEDSELFILVATSGDTGGAVASGFLGVKGIRVVILFPKGKVSPLQKKQLTTLGQNITAIQIDGTFDDCQAIVKKAFLDQKLSNDFTLSSANSINISRLIPQSFYYFNAVAQLKAAEEVVFVVPSGNFGNITAGIIAYQMGLNVKHFVAATNINDIVPAYLESGKYQPQQSRATISNAMDVGNPSNFPRLKKLLGSTWNNVKNKLKGYSYTDEQTRQAIKQVFKQYRYLMDPHGAVGYLAAVEYLQETHFRGPIIFLETAHPSKFKETVEDTLNVSIEIPKRLSELRHLDEVYHQLGTDYYGFRKWFRDHFENSSTI